MNKITPQENKSQVELDLDGLRPAEAAILPEVAELASSITHQVNLARSDRRMARWDRQMGIWPSDVPLSRSPGFYRANTAMKVARAFALEAKTGLSHCICHLTPIVKCASKSWARGFGRAVAA